jgi:murein DD-endopeptidase
MGIIVFWAKIGSMQKFFLEKNFLLGVLLSAFAFGSLPANAGFFEDVKNIVPLKKDQKFQFPVNCTLGEDCFILFYPDAYNTTRQADHKCGLRTFDQNQATVITSHSIQQMLNGIAVLAAADGKVTKVKKDSELSDDDNQYIKNSSENCGNQVVISHGQGWETHYCFLKPDSILVSEKQLIKKGEQIAEMGSVGYTQSLPNLYFYVYHNNKAVDPFVGPMTYHACNTVQKPLWDTMIPYQSINIIGAGVDDRPINRDYITEFGGMHKNRINSTSKNFGFWIFVAGLLDGDEEIFEVYEPGGNLEHNYQGVIKNFKGFHYYINAIEFDKPAKGFKKGTWKLRYLALRKSKPILKIERIVEVI